MSSRSILVCQNLVLQNYSKFHSFQMGCKQFHRLPGGWSDCDLPIICGPHREIHLRSQETVASYCSADRQQNAPSDDGHH